MVADWRDSETNGGRFRLFEHEYEVPVAQEDKRIAVNVVMRSLRNFFRSPTLERALAVGRSRWLALEDLVSYPVGSTEVFLRMDLAYRELDGRVVIVDWKTGRSEGRFNEVQVAGYALYAAEQGWAGDPGGITTELDYLMLPKVVRRTVTAQKIEDVRRFIQTSAASMKALLVDPLDNTAREEDFPRVERPRVCCRCNFRRLCFPRGVEPAGLEPPPGALAAAPRQVEAGTAAPSVAPVGDGVR
jgi:CRISPR/Cas system-associated exonuclease Cas4 (RecB family)